MWNRECKLRKTNERIGTPEWAFKTFFALPTFGKISSVHIAEASDLSHFPVCGPILTAIFATCIAIIHNSLFESHDQPRNCPIGKATVILPITLYLNPRSSCQIFLDWGTTINHWLVDARIVRFTWHFFASNATTIIDRNSWPQWDENPLLLMMIMAMTKRVLVIFANANYFCPCYMVIKMMLTIWFRSKLNAFASAWGTLFCCRVYCTFENIFSHTERRRV